jgi:penicillin-insensitive murein DD-endopeptidase
MKEFDVHLLVKCLFIVFIPLSAFATEAAGFYSNGRLIDGISINHRDGHFLKLFVGRKMFYATSELLDDIQTLSSKMRVEFPNVEPMQIGDLSGPDGGKIPRHKSHHHGLDADIVYFRNDLAVQSPHTPEWDEYFVKNDQITENFDTEKNWRLFESIVEVTDVNRIFVDWAIKKHYCLEFQKRGLIEKMTPILRRLRPATYHITHLHLRIKCPSSHSNCIDQTEPADGHGCKGLASDSNSQDEL